MRTLPTDSDDLKDLEVLKVQPWQVDLLKLNPSYVYWGNDEDSMGSGSGWSAPATSPTWKQHIADWSLDELNEIVNFYFKLTRDNHECPHCEGSNLNEATKKLYDDWYSFGREKWVYVSSNRRYNDYAWSNHITDVEVEALVKGGRLRDLVGMNVYFDDETQKWMKWENREKVECERPEMPSAESVNEWNKKSFGHDAINQWICVRARAEHQGVYGNCPHCEGGYVYDAPEGKASLQLWYLHPRKGAARGVLIEQVDQDDLPSIISLLQEARKRNDERFSLLDNFKTE